MLGVDASRAANQLTATIRADVAHGSRARRTKRAFVAANECFAIGNERYFTPFAVILHGECHLVHPLNV